MFNLKEFNQKSFYNHIFVVSESLIFHHIELSSLYSSNHKQNFTTQHNMPFISFLPFSALFP